MLDSSGGDNHVKKDNIKKGIVITLIAVCCLMAFAIFMLLSNKISYTVEEVNGTYNVSVNNRWGKRIYENAYGVEPIIMQAKQRLIVTHRRLYGILTIVRLTDIL